MDHGASVAFRFLDLPPEIRIRIYHYYYGIVEPVLHYYHTLCYTDGKYARQRWATWRDQISPSALTLTVSGVHDFSIHQVSKFVASEAKPIWHIKTTSILIDASENGPVIPDFFIDPVFSDLKDRLVSLQIITTGFEQDIPWLGLLRSCPDLKIIDLVLTSVHDDTVAEQNAKYYVYNVMNECFAGICDGLDDYGLMDLVWVLGQLDRKGCQVTRTVRRVAYDSSVSKPIGTNGLLCQDVSRDRRLFLLNAMVETDMRLLGPQSSSILRGIQNGINILRSQRGSPWSLD